MGKYIFQPLMFRGHSIVFRGVCRTKGSTDTLDGQFIGFIGSHAPTWRIIIVNCIHLCFSRSQIPAKLSPSNVYSWSFMGVSLCFPILKLTCRSFGSSFWNSSHETLRETRARAFSQGGKWLGFGRPLYSCSVEVPVFHFHNCRRKSKLILEKFWIMVNHTTPPWSCGTKSAT